MFFGAREFHSEGKIGREEFVMSAMLLIMVPQLLVLIVLNNTSSSKV